MSKVCVSHKMRTLGVVTDLTKPPGCGCKHCLWAVRTVVPSASRRSRLKPGTIKLFKEFTRALEPQPARLSDKVDERLSCFSK